MTTTYVFVCNLHGGCQAVIKIKTDRKWFTHPFIQCPVCYKNAQLEGKEY